SVRSVRSVLSVPVSLFRPLLPSHSPSFRSLWFISPAPVATRRRNKPQRPERGRMRGQKRAEEGDRNGKEEGADVRNRAQGAPAQHRGACLAPANRRSFPPASSRTSGSVLAWLAYQYFCPLSGLPHSPSLCLIILLCSGAGAEQNN